MDPRLIALACLAALAWGCAPEPESGSYSSDSSSSTSSETIDSSETSNSTPTETASTAAPEPEPMEDKPLYTPKDGDEVAVMTTNHGEIVLMFFPDKAPNHVKRFKDAIKEGVYKGVKFHRVIPGFMIQGGDPNSKDDDRSNDGSGGWGTPLKAEFNEIKHVPGILSAARTSDPNSASSQFFLMHGTAPSLDRQYTVYGYAVRGLDVINKIVNLPRDPRDNPNAENPAIIEDVKLVKWPI